MKIIELIISLFISIIFYKDGIHKMDDTYGYYLIISDFKISQNKLCIKFITSLLISLDLTIVLGMLSNSTRIASCILGIVLEIFYLTIMLKNHERGFLHGCNCYIINATTEVKFIDILKIMGIIFMFSFILII
ncbi:MauE/DoxX family redox-associated membrane protein [Clostridium botulinum]|uniref:MauE/DoxX family redox-associated membrane protein n=1 Tax=Clostridium botulinum TaxID=1491 RepID=UPI00035DC3B7|nr:MauE/DoxX family redox-associated membrane protein [Clostridium botulinum]MBY6932193.1 hypothetical protein [Clostridium botulinum]